MDIGTLRQQDTYEHQLTTPGGDKLDVVFTLAGPSHPAREAYDRKEQRRSLREFNKAGKARLPDDPEELEEKAIDRLVAYTLGWRDLELDGSPLQFSADNARTLYQDPRFRWLRDDVAGAVSSLENFMTRSSAS